MIHGLLLSLFHTEKYGFMCEIEFFFQVMLFCLLVDKKNVSWDKKNYIEIKYVDKLGKHQIFFIYKEVLRDHSNQTKTWLEYLM